MLRISPVESGNHHTRACVLLRLEGRVVGPWVAELGMACEKILGEGQALELDLAEVSFLDPAGISLLANVRSRGVELVDCSPFIAEQLKGAAAETTINGSGVINLGQTETLKANINGSGEVTYVGIPSGLEEHVSGSGTVRRAQ